MFVKLVDDKIGYSIPFQINYNAGAFFIVGFIVYMSNSLDHLVVYQDANAIGQFIAVHLVWNLGDNNLFATARLRIYVKLTSHHYLASAQMHGGFNSFHSVNNSTGWKVRRFNMSHQLIYRH